MLKFITNVPWEYGDVVADYHINNNTCVLYLRCVCVCVCVCASCSLPLCASILYHEVVCILVCDPSRAYVFMPTNEPVIHPSSYLPGEALKC